MTHEATVHARLPTHLVLFLTRGVPLRVWEQIGSFTREVAIYRRLVERGIGVSVVSWGGADELQYSERLPGIRICCNRWGLPAAWYERLVPWLHARVLRSADLIKTNQTNGADVALAAARRWRKPLVARCGYMWSKNRILEDGRESAPARRALAIESQVFGAAEAVVVTTGEMRDDLAQRFPARVERVEVIPNYVDTAEFTPGEGDAGKNERRVVFIGRLSPEKNLLNLLDACEALDLELEVIGEGPMRGELEAGAARGRRLRLMGSIPHSKLPERIRAATIFALPSLYEGHPKTLIEAMACGAAVLGTDVTGINAVARHGETGWLTGTSAEELRAGLEHLLASRELRSRLGAAARAFAVEHYSLDRIVEQELAMYAKVLINDTAPVRPT